MLTGRKLESLVKDGNPEKIEEYYTVLYESPYYKNLTFNVYKSLKIALFQK